MRRFQTIAVCTTTYKRWILEIPAFSSSSHDYFSSPRHTAKGRVGWPLYRPIRRCDLTIGLAAGFWHQPVERPSRRVAESRKWRACQSRVGECSERTPAPTSRGRKYCCIFILTHTGALSPTITHTHTRTQTWTYAWQKVSMSYVSDERTSSHGEALT